MTDDEILKKVIEKAEKNGFDLTGYLPAFSKTIIWDCRFEIIFSHDFAKAFWGEEIIETYGWDKGNHDDNTERELAYFCYTYKKPAWKHHLQQMVLEEKPIEYLGRFLK